MTANPSPLERARHAAAAGRLPPPREPEAPPPAARLVLWKLVPRKFKALRRALGEPPRSKRPRKPKPVAMGGGGPAAIEAGHPEPPKLDPSPEARRARLLPGSVGRE